VHPSAPCRPPSMTLAGVKARHNWLDNRMQVIGYDKIASDDGWRDARKLLGDAVHEVIQHLQVHPPDVLEITDEGLRNIQAENSMLRNAFKSKPTGTSASGSSRAPVVTTEASQQEAPPDYDTILDPPPIVMPKIPTHFPQIDSLTCEEMEELLDDELAFLAFCNSLSFAQTLRAKATATLDENAAAARAHLQHESALTALHNEVTDLVRQLNTETQTFHALQQRQDAVCAPPDWKIAARELQALKRASFEASEQLTSDLEAFMRERKLHHVYAAKLELLQYNNNS
jgi:hypothetical protein